MTAYDTDVLIVGTGPTGGAAALALATYGIRAHVVTRWNWLANTPRAHITNQRALEVLRDLGVEQEAGKYATPWAQMGETPFATSLAGEEIVRLPSMGTGEDRLTEYVAASPCPFMDIPQSLLEPILVKNAATRGAHFEFNTEYLRHTQDSAGVTAYFRDRLTEREYSMRARYLIGADGARSQIVDELGLPLEGTMARAATAYVLFHADLSRYVEHRPSIVYWMMTPSANQGEIGMGLLRTIRPWHTWIAGWGVDLSAGEPDLSPEVMLAKIRSLVGDPEVDIDMQTTSVWYVNQAHATQYSKGRVFCGGDAVHRHPPSNGLGSNTSIQDSFNLAWKLAFVLKGYAGERLLKSYSDERVPVGEQIVVRANQSRLEYAPLRECFRTSDKADPVAAGLAKLRDPGPDGVKVRDELVRALELKHYEYNAHGVELNQRYSSTAVVPDPTVGPEVFDCDPELYAVATTRPGAKLPHVWLVDKTGRRVSTLDVTGKGSFSLVTGLSGQAWVQACDKLELPFLRAVVIGSKGAEDLYCSWARVREIDEAGALLVRPDGYIAWRQPKAVWDNDEALTQLRRALSAILDLAY